MTSGVLFVSLPAGVLAKVIVLVAVVSIVVVVVGE